MFASRRVGFSLLLLGCPSALLARPDRPPRPATLPSFTHTLVLDPDAGDQKGQPPRHFGLYLPEDWQTTGTSAKFQFDDRYDPRGMSPDEPPIVDLVITHDRDGSILFERPGLMDAYFHVTVHAVDATHFTGTWETFAMFGPSGGRTSSSGTATLTAFRRPTTRAD